MSKNHQYLEFEEKIVKRYAKTTNSALTGYRLDPHRPENRINWMLISPKSSFSVIWEDGKEPKIQRIKFSYDDEVIELYSDIEVKLFERLNKAAIENGALRVYTEQAPGIDTTNLLTDPEIEQLATTKQLPSLKKKISTITSIHTLNRVLERVEAHDRPLSVARAIQDRINELSRNN